MSRALFPLLAIAAGMPSMHIPTGGQRMSEYNDPDERPRMHPYRPLPPPPTAEALAAAKAAGRAAGQKGRKRC